MRTVPVCALHSVDAATMISAAANMAAPNFMARKNPSIVASQRLLLTSQLIKVREFSRPVEGVKDRGEYRQAAEAFAQERLLNSISPVTKKTLENHAGAMLPFSGLFLLLSRVQLRCGNKNDYGCGMPSVGRRISRMGANRFKGKLALGIH